jgi:hypothetical protein
MKRSPQLTLVELEKSPKELINLEIIITAVESAKKSYFNLNQLHQNQTAKAYLKEETSATL